MLYMNYAEIEQAKYNFAKHPVMSRAAHTLYDLVLLTNEVSDGWAYWSIPCTAAKKLQELIQKVGIWRRLRSDEVIAGVDEKTLKEAYRPIKAILTRRKKEFEGKTLTFH